jgi:hypothetical protein
MTLRELHEKIAGAASCRWTLCKRRHERVLSCDTKSVPADLTAEEETMPEALFFRVNAPANGNLAYN